MPGAAQCPIERHHQDECHADGREVAEDTRLVPAVRVDHGERRRQLGLGGMVVDNDDLEPPCSGSGERRVSGSATVEA